jgi:hypothetical protein
VPRGDAFGNRNDRRRRPGPTSSAGGGSAASLALKRKVCTELQSDGTVPDASLEERSPPRAVTGDGFRRREHGAQIVLPFLTRPSRPGAHACAALLLSACRENDRAVRVGCRGHRARERKRKEEARRGGECSGLPAETCTIARSCLDRMLVDGRPLPYDTAQASGSSICHPSKGTKAASVPLATAVPTMARPPQERSERGFWKRVSKRSRWPRNLFVTRAVYGRCWWGRLGRGNGA